MSNLRLSILLTRSQLHLGTGEAIGAIDRPVSRQVVTRHPNLPSSALKRALKDAMAAGVQHAGTTALTADEHRAMFGAAMHAVAATSAPDSAAPSPDGAGGMLAPQEGQLLLLPVACLAGGGAWVTSPAVWQRLRRSAALAGVQAPPLPMAPATSSACCGAGSPLRTHVPGTDPTACWVVLGSAALACQAQPDGEHTAWHAWTRWVAETAFGNASDDWGSMVMQRLVIVSDTVLDGLLLQGLVDRARNSVGTTVNLWREEAVPEDTVFHLLVGATPLAAHHRSFASPAAALERLNGWLGAGGAMLQLGGNASLGQGMVQWRLVPPAAAMQPGERHHA